jgi:N utilization substance protein A
MQVLIPNSLQPAEVDEVILCQMMGRAIVLVREDQLSLAIGKRGQNVRLASKLCGWDIEIMTQTELESQIDRAVRGFCDIEGVDEDLANQLVGEGYLSYDDLSVIEPTDLIAMGELTEEDVDKIVDEAEKRALVAEKRAEEEKKLRKQQQAIEKAAEEARAKEEAAQKAAQRQAELEAGRLKAAGDTPDAPEGDSSEEAATGAADAAKTE